MSGDEPTEAVEAPEESKAGLEFSKIKSRPWLSKGDFFYGLMLGCIWSDRPRLDNWGAQLKPVAVRLVPRFAAGLGRTATSGRSRTQLRVPPATALPPAFGPSMFSFQRIQSTLIWNSRRPHCRGCCGRRGRFYSPSQYRSLLSRKSCTCTITASSWSNTTLYCGGSWLPGIFSVASSRNATW